MIGKLVILGIIISLIGLVGVFVKRNPSSSGWLTSKFGEGWQGSLAGMWFGWHLVAAGAILVYFELVERGGSQLFTMGSILGTAAVAISFISLIAKQRPAGRAWFERRFGIAWESTFQVKFLGWPLLVVGLAMWLPDSLWRDAVKLAGGLIAYWIYTLIYKKKTAPLTPSDDDIITPPFTEEAGSTGGAHAATGEKA